MKVTLANTAKLAVLGAAIAILLGGCHGHYNPRLHVDDTPAPPGHVKLKYHQGL